FRSSLRLDMSRPGFSQSDPIDHPRLPGGSASVFGPPNTMTGTSNPAGPSGSGKAPEPPVNPFAFPENLFSNNSQANFQAATKFPNITKLNGSNYHSWSTIVHKLLTFYGWVDYVDKPCSLRPTPTEQHYSKLVHLSLLNWVDESLVKIVASCSSPHNVWNALRSKFTAD